MAEGSGRVSKFQNDRTTMTSHLVNISLTDIESFTLANVITAQETHGISDQLLAEMAGMTKGNMAHLKSGRVPFKGATKIALYFFFKQLE